MLATTRAALLRGTTTVNDFGDEVEANTVVNYAGNLPASITETSRSVFDPDSGTWTTVREYTGRLPATLPRGVVIQDGDRLRDNRTGYIYQIVEEERTPRSISGRASLSLSLRRISA